MVSELFAIGYALPFVSLFLFAYAAYWALSTRKALAVRLYRNQALGVAVVSMAFGLWILVTLVSPVVYRSSFPGPIGQVTSLLVLLIFFYWVDTSALAARRSNPRLRDTLHWKSVRKAVWGIEILLYSSYFLVAALTGDTPGLSPPTGLGPTQAAFFDIVSFFVLPIILIPLISGIILLPIGARRSGDSVLRNNLKWFGLAAGLFFVFFIGGSLFYASNTDLAVDIQLTGFLLGGFSLYRSAKSLVPLNRISLTDLASPLGKGTSLKPNTSLGHMVRARLALTRR